MYPQIKTLTEYFECDLRLRDEGHTLVGKVFLRLLPRIGEGMTVVLPGKVEPTEFTINHISHVAGTSTTNHVVTIYVEEGGMPDVTNALEEWELSRHDSMFEDIKQTLRMYEQAERHKRVLDYNKHRNERIDVEYGNYGK